MSMIFGLIILIRLLSSQCQDQNIVSPVFNPINVTSVIDMDGACTSTNGAHNVLYCPDGYFVNGGQIEYEPDAFADNTAVNDFQLICAPLNDYTYAESQVLCQKKGSTSLPWYDKTRRQQLACNYNNFVTGIRVKQDGDGCKGLGVTNVQLHCTHGTLPEYSVDVNDGGWLPWKYCNPGSYVCGIQVTIEPYQGVPNDDAGLTRIQLGCCSYYPYTLTPTNPPTRSTVAPSVAPSATPSVTPTETPTETPTKHTTEPTITPSVVTVPPTKSTNAPSANPTLNTVTPTTNPTTIPTSLTIGPTNQTTSPINKPGGDGELTGRRGNNNPLVILSIVLGVILCFVLLIVFLYCMKKRKKDKDGNENVEMHQVPSQPASQRNSTNNAAIITKQPQTTDDHGETTPQPPNNLTQGQQLPSYKQGAQTYGGDKALDIMIRQDDDWDEKDDDKYLYKPDNDKYAV